ncbi:protein phosphatase 2C domain-containing protein [Streptomyces geranii]|uniref:protein phosphatase 2C domain-containing protein n=1 Tax=Streptomyces geranii TaxID=2058923 RepID=UPI000D03C3F2|nr:protein phosphatase 2C domain-containing protein [Streptomyces geranii]
MGDIPALPRAQWLWTQKSGSGREEYEDAAYCWQSGEAAADGAGRPVASLYVAVSDGASESLLARDWARLLVRDAVESMRLAGDWWQELPTFVRDLMDRSAAHWDAFLIRYQAERAAQGRPIAWYEQPGLEKGAFATVLGAEVRAVVLADGTTRWHWYAFALGDSCLFQVRDGRLLESFPVRTVEEFGITPQLLGSRNHDVELVARRMRLASGELLPGDELLLATDALAAWLLSRTTEAEPRGLVDAPAFASFDQEDFAEWVDDQRARARMRNDDVTLVRARVGAEA